MRQKNKERTLPSIVGIVDGPAARAAVSRLSAGDVDFLEWRADGFSAGTRIPAAPVPWVLTARDPREGGFGDLSVSARRAVLLENLPKAAMVDIELRNARAMSVVITAAKASSCKVISSFHDFKKTPSAAVMQDLLNRAADSGADVVKVATLARSPQDVGCLLDLFGKSALPLAVMGMGPLGMASRLLFACCGSALNYGWLHRPNVPGQWSAVELRTLLERSGSRP